MALSNSQYDAIMRAYGRQQIENHHQLEERRREIYRKLPVIRELEAEIAGRSVACARKLLETTDMSVTEVAEQCGFSSVSFFIRSFNRVNGCSPLKWRQFH